jgi:hypothetical protein
VCSPAEDATSGAPPAAVGCGAAVGGGALAAGGVTRHAGRIDAAGVYIGLGRTAALSGPGNERLSG